MHSIFHSQLLALDTCIRDASHSYDLSNDKDSRVEVDTSSEFQLHHFDAAAAAAAAAVVVGVTLLLLLSMD